MSRFAPALLVCLLACTSSTRADDAFPPLDQRLGRTITVVEKNFPTEKAVITNVWRLDDGTPCMQAMGQTSKTKMTLIENTSAKSAADRIKIHRWVNGVCPVGCPVAPATKTPAATVKQTQYEAPKAVVSAPSSDKVASTEGGLMPVLPKKEEVIVAPPAVINQPAPVVSRALPSTLSVPVTPTLPSVREVPPLPPVTPPATVVVKQPVSAPAVIKTVPATTIQPPPVPSQPAAAAPAPTVAKPELVGGCEVITVTENGTCRKYKVIGTARDAHGVMNQRCQALDNGEIVTLNCDNCSKGNACATAAPCKPACTPAPIACTPAPVKCEPAKVVCTPAPVKCEPAKVVCAPAPCKTECKPCVTAPKACEPCVTATKTCDPCATAGNKGCDSCATAKSCESCNSGRHCLDKKCGVCGGAEGGCDACRGKNGLGLGGCGAGGCGLFCQRCSLFEQGGCLSCLHKNHYYGSLSVPVPGVRLNACNGLPGGPPPQPLIPAFCTMNSSSVRCYMNAPQIVPFACLNPPFRSCMNSQISAGIYEQNGVNGEAVTSTLYLINVLAQSKEWENRQWAAQRLQGATLPTVRPYVEDALITAAQGDRSPQVKVAAIRTLASLKSNRQEVMAMLSYAVVDEDPRIKEAANEAINVLYKSNGVQQASYAK